MLVGKRVRQFVDQSGAILDSAARSFQDEQLLLVVVVERCRLLGEQVHGVLAQVEIGGDQAQHLEGQLFGAHVGRFDGFFDALVQEDAELLFGEDAIGHGMLEAQAGDTREAVFDGSDFGKDWRRIGGVEQRDNQQQEQRDS